MKAVNPQRSNVWTWLKCMHCFFFSGVRLHKNVNYIFLLSALKLHLNRKVCERSLNRILSHLHLGLCALDTCRDKELQRTFLLNHNLLIPRRFESQELQSNCFNWRGSGHRWVITISYIKGFCKRISSSAKVERLSVFKNCINSTFVSFLKVFLNIDQSCGLGIFNTLNALITLGSLEFGGRFKTLGPWSQRYPCQWRHRKVKNVPRSGRGTDYKINQAAVVISLRWNTKNTHSHSKLATFQKLHSTENPINVEVVPVECLCRIPSVSSPIATSSHITAAMS